MPDYIGRFAPSPTGPLHLGSLIGALTSYLDAKASQGYWLLRIEDIDPPREMQGAAQIIQDCLIYHGLHWDGEICWQSKRLKCYADAVNTLLKQNNAYYCTCSRKDLKATNGIYPGYCREKNEKPESAFAIRAKLPNRTIVVDDLIQGYFQQQLQQELGDIVIQRKDSLYAYQLAVVIDDAHQNITHVVRGSDILDSTPRQIALQQLLGLPTPQYAHFPVITNQQGQKLSKQHGSQAVCNTNATGNLLKSLKFLNQPLPPYHLCKQTGTILDWAVEHWAMKKIPRTRAICELQTNKQT